MVRKLCGYALTVAAVVLASCGGGGGMATSPIMVTTSNGTPPAALALITPAANLPTVPPVGATVPPVEGSPTITSAPSAAASTPVPAPTGSDLAALVNGQPPSAAYFASLSQAAQSSYTLLAPDAPRAINGTITGFSSGSISISVSAPIDPGYASANGLPYAAGRSAAGAAQAVVLVSNQTVDYVAGGFGALRVGQTLLAIGKGPAAAFTAAVVLGGTPANPTDTAQPARIPPDADTTTRRSMARSATSTSARQRIPFALTTSKGIVSTTLPEKPYLITLPSRTRCVSASVIPSVTFGSGVQANFPMEIDDISTPQSFVEATTEPLPIALVNAPIPAPSVAQYTINIGLAATLDLNVTLKGCHSAIVPDGVYPFNLVTLGQDESEFGYGPAPGAGQTLTIKQKNCPYIGIPFFVAPAFIVNTIYSPSFQLCIDDYMMGASIKGAATIDNAKLITTPGSGPTSDTSWDYLSPLPGGDPQVTFMPYAAAYDASVLPNLLTLQSVEYDATDYANVAFNLSVFGITVPLVTDPHYPSLSVFQNPGGSFRTGVSNPAAVLVTLHPSEGAANITGK